MKAMLAIPIDTYMAGRGNRNDGVEYFLKYDKWCAQEKADGHRVMIEVRNHDVTVLNRNGEKRGHAVPSFITDVFSKLPFDAIFDGELVGTGTNMKLQLFDFPWASRPGEWGGEVLCSARTAFIERFSILSNFMNGWAPDPRIEVLPVAESEDAKRALLAWVEEQGREGLIFKACNGPYQPGARSLGQIKYKFRQDADVIVLDKGVGGKDNLVLGAYEPGATKPIEIGHCTALNGDGDVIQIGEVITVNYVHFSKGKRLVQPTLPRRRKMNDKSPIECTTDQFRTAYGK